MRRLIKPTLTIAAAAAAALIVGNAGVPFNASNAASKGAESPQLCIPPTTLPVKGNPVSTEVGQVPTLPPIPSVCISDPSSRLLPAIQKIRTAKVVLDEAQERLQDVYTGPCKPPYLCFGTSARANSGR